MASSKVDGHTATHHLRIKIEHKGTGLGRGRGERLDRREKRKGILGKATGLGNPKVEVRTVVKVLGMRERSWRNTLKIRGCNCRMSEVTNFARWISSFLGWEFFPAHKKESVLENTSNLGFGFQGNINPRRQSQSSCKGMPRGFKCRVWIFRKNKKLRKNLGTGNNSIANIYL